jgi:hypothetical protein
MKTECSWINAQTTVMRRNRSNTGQPETLAQPIKGPASEEAMPSCIARFSRERKSKAALPTRRGPD